MQQTPLAHISQLGRCVSYCISCRQTSPHRISVLFKLRLSTGPSTATTHARHTGCNAADWWSEGCMATEVWANVRTHLQNATRVCGSSTAEVSEKSKDGHPTSCVRCDNSSVFKLLGAKYVSAMTLYAC